ncbi:unnamed protein product [Lactuca virosa]|uniref:Uncharacterized protein n=1 Tax=Lactuca virosa TaxID=75947 RepID=A0AAU9PPV5_9ASTR|nr:unnamed protein product [Lactuca virosa]
MIMVVIVQGLEMGTQSSEVIVPDFRRKKLVVRRPNRKSTTKFQDEVNNQVPNEVAQAPAVNDVPLVNKVIEEEDDIMVLEEEAVDVPVKVAQDLKENASDVPLLNEGGAEPEFTEGLASDVLPDKIKIDVEGIANLLEAGYSMAETESIGW